MLGDASKTSVFLNDTFDGARAKATEITRGVRNILVGRVIEKEGGEAVGPGI